MCHLSIERNQMSLVLGNHQYLCIFGISFFCEVMTRLFFGVNQFIWIVFIIGVKFQWGLIWKLESPRCRSTCSWKGSRSCGLFSSFKNLGGVLSALKVIKLEPPAGSDKHELIGLRGTSLTKWGRPEPLLVPVFGCWKE